MTELVKQKKFKVAAVAAVWAALLVFTKAYFGVDLTMGELVLMISPFLTYIGGQGIADFGKEAAKITAAAEIISDE